MNSIEAYQQACSLFVDEQYEEALRLFSLAIEAAKDQQVVEYYIKRSACHYKLKNFTEALEDANSAISRDQTNAKAFFRKGLACFSLEEFETAKSAFEKGQALDPGDANFKLWIRKCEAELAESSPVSSKSSPAPTFAVAPSEPTMQRAPLEPRVRHTWYQNESFVYVTFYQKNLTEEDVSVDFQSNRLSVTLKLPDTTFHFDCNLCDSIVPQESRKSIGKTNVEIKLKKTKPAHWASLEKLVTDKPLVNPWPDTSSANKHLYPSSSKVKRDWDKLAAEVGEEKPEGEAALNKVFQDIYASGTEEQRRAMIKSFTESGGTVLSTNWEEVGKAPVKGSPPKGMEMKTYQE